MLGRFLPQGGQGFGAALQDASPLLLAMAQGMQSGQGAFSGAPTGIAAMMANVDKRKGDAVFQSIMGGGQPGAAAPSLASVMGQQQQQQMARPADGTIPQTGVPQTGAFPASLVRTESGGNWAALNNEMGAGGRGHGGRLQFGHARLADAARSGVIGQMTPQQFAQQPPEVQQQVENWHFGDIDRQAAARGLDRFIGQEIGGVMITQDAIRAMAHLGGIGGAASFLESGGQNNPADANGTSLRDYARIHGGTNQYGQPVQMQAPDPANLQRLYEAYASPYLSEPQRQAIGMRIQQEQARNTPMTPMEQIQLEAAQLQLEQARNPAPAAMPAAVQELEWRAMQSGLVPGTPEYQQFMLNNGEMGGGNNQTERDIALLGEIGIPRAQAIEITQLNQVTRDPITGQVSIVNRATGQPVGGAQTPQQVTAAPEQASPSEAIGLRYTAAPESFGIGGALRRGANTIADVAGVDMPYPEVNATQSDFAVLRESLLNDIASGYGRQPPSWLLKDIRDLTPAAGNPTQGAGSARSQLESLKRHFESETRSADQALTRRLSPTEQQAAETRAASLRQASARVDAALAAFGPRAAASDGLVTPPQPGVNVTSTGVEWSIDP